MESTPKPSPTAANPSNGYHCEEAQAGFEYTDIRFILRKISGHLDESFLKWQKAMEQVSLLEKLTVTGNTLDRTCLSYMLHYVGELVHIFV